MKRALALSVIVAGLGASALGQQPQIQNGRVETRPGASGGESGVRRQLG